MTHATYTPAKDVPECGNWPRKPRGFDQANDAFNESTMDFDTRPAEFAVGLVAAALSTVGVLVAVFGVIVPAIVGAVRLLWTLV